VPPEKTKLPLRATQLDSISFSSFPPNFLLFCQIFAFNSFLPVKSIPEETIIIMPGRTREHKRAVTGPENENARISWCIYAGIPRPPVCEICTFGSAQLPLTLIYFRELLMPSAVFGKKALSSTLPIPTVTLNFSIISNCTKMCKKNLGISPRKGIYSSPFGCFDLKGNVF
jgi:hypothetical protein